MSIKKNSIPAIAMAATLICGHLSLPLPCLAFEPSPSLSAASAEIESDAALDTTGGGQSQPSELQGTVEKIEVATPRESLDDLLKTACDNSELNVEINKKDRRLQRGVRKLWGVTKDMAQWATSYKGFEGSSEAADVILDDKVRLKSAPAIDYARQKQYDEYHVRITSALCQIAMGLGSKDSVKGERSIARAREELVALAGESEADEAIAEMRSWAAGLKVPDAVFEEETCDVFELQTRSKQLIAKKLERDDVLVEVTKKLRKFNGHSNLMRITAKLANTALSIAALSPSIVSPAAQAAQMVFIMATGGPEESKLLHEVYLDRRLASRLTALTKESTLIVNSHNLAVVTRNPVLFAFSEHILEDMAGSKENLAVILSGEELAEEDPGDAVEKAGVEPGTEKPKLADAALPRNEDPQEAEEVEENGEDLGAVAAEPLELEPAAVGIID